MRRWRVHWSPRAARALEEILSHIRKDAPGEAEAFLERVARSVRRLESFPESGRKVPELSDQAPAPREIIMGDYRLIYRTLPGRIQIVLMIHGRRRFP